MNSPAVSVIIPLYNKSAYIVRAVRSALMQRPAPAEVLVIDDGSTDDGPALVRQMDAYPQLRLISQQNGGEGAARNRGLAEMRGDLAAFLDADDEWAPDHLRNLLEVVERCPGAGLVATGYRTVYGRGVQVETTIGGDRPVMLRDYFETARGGFCLHISSCAVWKAVAEEAGGFAKREPLGADLEFFARVALRQPVALHPAISGIYYAAHAGSALHTHGWTKRYPPVFRLLRTLEAAAPGTIASSARDYADWILTEHAITGMCAGRRNEALGLLGEVGSRLTRPVWLLRVAATVLPLMLLRTLIRVRRSRLSVARPARRRSVIQRVVYSHA